jgi:integrase
MSRTFEHLVQQSGVRRIRFHDLRHTCASLTMDL